MRPAILAPVVLLWACDARDKPKPAPREPAVTMAPRDSANRELETPRVVTEPTLIVFWLPAGDTLQPEDAAAALDELNYYTEQIGPSLARWGVRLLPTNAETLYIALPNHKRRSVLLSGLDFPFGYVIAEPGGIERVLPGVYPVEELLEEVRVYFYLEEDTATAAPPRRVITE